MSCAMNTSRRKLLSVFVAAAVILLTAKVGHILYIKRCHQTLLHTAVSRRDQGMARLLLAVGVDVNGKDNYQRTPLHWAAAMGDVAMVKLLLATGADVSAQDIKRYTPLHMGAEGGSLEVARILLDHGAKPNAKTGSERETPADCALRAGHPAVAELIRKGTKG
jgi:cytohesin